MMRLRVDERLRKLILQHREAMQKTMGRRVPIREASGDFARNVEEYYANKRRKNTFR